MRRLLDGHRPRGRRADAPRRRGRAGARNRRPRPRTPRTPRIITLAPNATELVYAAGAGADIVGTVLRSDYPADALSIPRIGDGIQFSEETILTLHPTLVVGWQPSDGSRSLARRLAPLGVPLIYADPKSLDDIPALIRDAGRTPGYPGGSRRRRAGPGAPHPRPAARAAPVANRLHRDQRRSAVYPGPGPH